MHFHFVYDQRLETQFSCIAPFHRCLLPDTGDKSAIMGCSAGTQHTLAYAQREKERRFHLLSLIFCALRLCSANLCFDRKNVKKKKHWPLAIAQSAICKRNEFSSTKQQNPHAYSFPIKSCMQVRALLSVNRERCAILVNVIYPLRLCIVWWWLMGANETH